MPRDWEANRPAQRACSRRQQASSRGDPPEAVCMVLFGGWGVVAFFFFYSQGLACYNSSFSSRSTGYWLAGPAVTSEKGSQSEQDSACLPAADCWSCNKQELQIQPGTALSRAKPGGTRGLRAESQSRDLLRSPSWPLRGALAKLPFQPGSIFSEYLTFKANMDVCGVWEREKPGGRNVGSHKIAVL